MKLKKLAIKFLTMALSLLTLFQVGCGGSYHYRFENFEELETFLLEKAIFGIGGYHYKADDKRYMVYPNELNLAKKVAEYLYETQQVTRVTYPEEIGISTLMSESYAKRYNLTVRPFKQIGSEYANIYTGRYLLYTLNENNEEECLFSLPKAANVHPWNYIYDAIEFCDCSIYLFGLEESCGIKHKQYNNGEFAFEHDCETQKLRIIWNGEDHSECFHFKNLSESSVFSYYSLEYLYSANCENCLNLINIPTELLNEWGLEYIHNDIHLYTLDPTNAPEGNARIVKIH